MSNIDAMIESLKNDVSKLQAECEIFKGFMHAMKYDREYVLKCIRDMRKETKS